MDVHEQQPLSFLCILRQLFQHRLYQLRQHFVQADLQPLQQVAQLPLVILGNRAEVQVLT